MTAAIFDLDGTLSNDSARKHLLKAKKYDEYNALLNQDSPNRGILELVNAMRERGHKIIICTARFEHYRWKTAMWLDKHHVHVDEMLMRYDGDMRGSVEVKQSMLDGLLAKNTDILFAVDDRDDVIQMYRRNHILALQCDEDEGVDI
jgi:phosphoserine phosphatase